MDAPAAFTAETLLEHESFVRAVARGLLGDADAGDVAQETWLRALGRGPRAGGDARGWLARVVANLARDRRRGAARRESRERRAARAEAQEGVGVAFERLSLQRDVVAAILALDEPYRGVVLLRYHHGLEPSEIAERLGAKPATVRTQLARAHELLRARLDSRYGRESWAALLLPAAATRTSAVALGATALGLVAAAALGWSLFARGTSARGARSEVAALAQSPESAERREPGDGESGAREPVAPEPAPAEAATAGAEELALATLARAELYALEQYADEELATFDFESGQRGDAAAPGRDARVPDVDLRFDGDWFEARTWVGEQGVLVDLGELPLRDLSAWRGALGAARERAEVRPGHAYFLWARDRDTDLAAAFEVLELVPGERCVLEWVATGDGLAGRASFDDDGARARLVRRLAELRAELRRPRELAAPRVLLQVRGGENSGNDYCIDVAGGLRHVARLSPLPLDLRAPIDSREAAYCEGGFVPEGRAFVVTRATWRGAALANAAKERALALVIGGERVAEVGRDEQPFEGAWTGRIEVLPGEEALTYLHLGNATVGEVELTGELVERPGLVARARPSTARAPREPVPAPAPLREPRARLQARKGNASPNEIRVRLDGSLSSYGSRSETALDLDAPLGSLEPPVTFAEGGTVPPGFLLVVTRVDYRGTGAAGAFSVVICGERVVRHERDGDAAGTWEGRIEVRAGDEKLVFLEVGNSSAAEAILYGEFAPAR